MKFTYSAYKMLIELLQKQSYVFADYHDYCQYDKVFILRHDVDFDLEKAANFSDFEKSIHSGLKSTYFVLISSDFYNVFSKASNSCIRRILDNGHSIGLHFDEEKYGLAGGIDEIEHRIIKEAELLGGLLGMDCIKTVSMHRPSKQVLNTKLHLKGLVNSYDTPFFEDFKYVSDSRMNWREDVLDIIGSESDKSLHILSHPIWYNEQEKSMKEIFQKYFFEKRNGLYSSLNDNFRDLQSVIQLEDL